MAGKKSTQSREHGDSPASPSQTQKPKKYRALRPTQAFVEIDSDEERRAKEPRLSGALRGLNPRNVLAEATPERTIELASDDDDDEHDTADDRVRHETRGARYGRADVNYNMKYHPMDEVTRPKRAQRMSGSRSLSAVELSSDGSDVQPVLDDDDDDSSSENDEDQSPPPAERVRDPRAVRHSARSEAKKSVNYSRKYHPQDYGLPGFKYNARKLAGSKKRRHGSLKAQPKHDVATPALDEDLSTIEISSGSEDSDDASDEDAVKPSATPQCPRKKLKSLGRSVHSSSPQKPAERARPQKKRRESAKKPSDRVDDIINGRHLFTDNQFDDPGANDAHFSSLNTVDLARVSFQEVMATNEEMPSATPFVICRPYLKPQVAQEPQQSPPHIDSLEVRRPYINSRLTQAPAQRPPHDDTLSSNSAVEQSPSADESASAILQTKPASILPSPALTRPEAQSPQGDSLSDPSTAEHSPEVDTSTPTTLQVQSAPVLASSTTLRQSSGSTNNPDEDFSSSYFEDAMANTSTLQEHMGEGGEHDTGFTVSQLERSDDKIPLSTQLAIPDEERKELEVADSACQSEAE